MARVRLQVPQHLLVSGARLRDARRPREVGEPVFPGGGLEPGGGQGVRPEAADAGLGLEDDGAEAALQHVLAGRQAADARPHDNYPLLVHPSRAI